jgi:Trypsin-like peptidase domain/Ankyrin repeats (many copies)
MPHAIRLCAVVLALVVGTTLLTIRAFTQTSRRRPRPSSTQQLTARQIARRILPSVVYIAMEDAKGKPICYGSGFFISEGHILTNKHVVSCSGTTRGRVNIAGNSKVYQINTTVTWPNLDVALVEAKGLTATPLQLDAQSSFSVGDDVFVAGNPEGLEGTFTRGIISSVRLSGDLLQIDAPVSKGSSGGPVVNAYGKVIGITISSIREGQNLNFAIPASSLAAPLVNMEQMIKRSKRDGAVRSAAEAKPLRNAPSSSPSSNTARQAWEASSDWSQFFSLLVGDTSIKEELKALLDSGVDVNAIDRGRRTALHHAAVLGQLEVARFLLSRGANINAKDAKGRTALMLAVGPGDLKIPTGNYAPLGDIWIGILCAISNGENESSQLSIEWAKWYSILEKRRSLIKLLLESGADVRATDDKGHTAFDHAAAGGVIGIERLLRETDKSSNQSTCDLTRGHAPSIRGLSLGMTTGDVSSRLGGFSLPSPNRCGLSYIAIPAKRLAMLSREFEGVSLLRLAFIDGKLTYLHLAYGSEFPWQGINEYLQTVASSLGLSGEWHRTSLYQSLDNARSISCGSYVVIAGYFKIPYVELHDTEALRVLVGRWDEAQRKRR